MTSLNGLKITTPNLGLKEASHRKFHKNKSCRAYPKIGDRMRSDPTSEVTWGRKLRFFVIFLAMAAWAVSDLGHENDINKPCSTCQFETFLFIQVFHQKNISRARTILRFFKKGPWGPFEASEAFDYEIKIYSALKVVHIGEVSKRYTIICSFHGRFSWSY